MRFDDVNDQKCEFKKILSGEDVYKLSEGFIFLCEVQRFCMPYRWYLKV